MRQEKKDHMSLMAEEGCSTDELANVSEMAIVDTFTKLIFGEQDNYQPLELLIIAAFRSVDTTVLRDTYEEMGAYLRNLGVREMIQLVGNVRRHLRDPQNALPQSLSHVLGQAVTSGVEALAGNTIDGAGRLPH